ncbi:MAG: hypothetical protein LJE57_01910 [Gallionella sp.]|nr:hypothetical protein [Gallionella sp.]
MSELSPEDELRLNVMMAGDIQAVRIDEAAMIVHGLSSRGEASIKLHPAGRSEQYLRRVRELLAGIATGSPGGYPVYLHGWTRMGQAREKGLDCLLLLGEEEAVVSVAYSNGLTDELARRAWWAMPVADNARRMLERDCVVQGKMGRVLAAYLVEYLPFETNPHTILDTVRLLLQPGLIDEEVRLKLWNRGAMDNAYHVGFLERMPDDLPTAVAPREDWNALNSRLAQFADDPCAVQLERVLSARGQAFLQTSEAMLRYPADRDVVNALLNALAAYFSPVFQPTCCDSDSLEAMQVNVEAFCSDPASAAGKFLESLPEYGKEVRAMLVLSCMNSEVAAPILSRTTAGGTLMRQKLEPITTPILQQIAVLRGQTFSATVPRRRSRA